MATILLDVWPSTGLPLPSQRAAELLLALLWVENARGRSIMNHNWGNLSSLGREGTTFWRPPWFRLEDVERIEDPAERERMGRIHQEMLDHRAPSAFEAHSDHFAGAKRWIERLHEKFPTLLEAAATGDAAQFAEQYGASNYCTSPVCQDVPRFARTFGDLADDAHRKGYLAGLAPAEAPASAAGGSAALVAVVALGAGAAAWYLLGRKRKRS